MGHVPIPSAGAPPPPAHWVGECFYCGRQFIYGDRSDCISCGGLLPMKRTAPPEPERQWFNAYVGASGGETLGSMSACLVSPWIGVESPSRRWAGS